MFKISASNKSLVHFILEISEEISGVKMNVWKNLVVWYNFPGKCEASGELRWVVLWSDCWN